MKHKKNFLFVAQDRQANGCLHTNSFDGRKDMEHKVRNVCVQNRVGIILLDFCAEEFLRLLPRCLIIKAIIGYRIFERRITISGL